MGWAAFFQTNLSRFQVLALALAIGWIYWPALHGEWLWNNMDVTQNENADTQASLGPLSAWSRPGLLSGYEPVTAGVQWAQWHLWGQRTTGYHLTNIVLHFVNALLVWWCLRKLGLKFAWLAGFIFAVHPMQVESVALVPELKGVLALPPFLLAAGFYLDYENGGRLPHYLFSFGLFVAALLANVAMAIFPFVILLHAWWKRGRIGWRDAKASTPFFAVSLLLGLVAVLPGERFQSLHFPGSGTEAPGGFLSWLALAGSSLAFYFFKALVPADLMPVYPQWTVDPPSLMDFLPLVALAGLVFWFWSARRTWGRHAMLGFGFFVLALLPSILIHAGGGATFAWVMDSSLYLPMIGLAGLLAAGFAQGEMQLPRRARIGGVGLVAAALGLMIWQSRVYAATFCSAETFWNYALAKNPNAWVVQSNLGNLLLRQGRMAEAIDHLKEAVKLNPGLAQSRNNLGNVLLRQGRVSEAVEQFETAVKVAPTDALAHANLSAALFQAGRMADAIEQDQEALRIDPDCAVAHYYWAVALVQLGQCEEAVAQDENALRLKPDYAEAQENWGFALGQMGHFWEAMGHYEQAIRLRPDLAGAQDDWGNALKQTGQLEDAIPHYREAVRLKPDDSSFHNDFGAALAQLGRKAEAADQFQDALRLNPDNHDAEANLKKLENKPAAGK